jgi:preprotein translocase subunit SecA
MDLEPNELNEENAQEIIVNGARQFLRSELTELEKYVLLQIYDSTWKDHLYAMDHLKGSVGLRGFAEKDPKMEYKREGFRMFQEMLSNIRDKVTNIIFKAQLESTANMRSVWNISSAMHSEYEQFNSQQEAAQRPQGQQMVKQIKLEKPKVGRNEPCPCGSGKKYKKCCGQGVGG